MPSNIVTWVESDLLTIPVTWCNFDISAEIPLKAFFMGYKITQVPTTWTDRKEGKSKFKVSKQGPRYIKLFFWALWKKVCRV